MGGMMGENGQTPAKLGEMATGARILPHIPMDLEPRRSWELMIAPSTKMLLR